MIYRVSGVDYNHWGVSAHVGTWFFNSAFRALTFINMYPEMRWSMAPLEKE